LIIIIVWIA